MTIFYLYKPPESDSFKVFLAFRMNEVTARHRPPFDDAGKRYWSGCWEVEVVGCPKSKVGEELDVADVVRSEL
jgi:hypothetical protein